MTYLIVQRRHTSQPRYFCGISNAARSEGLVSAWTPYGCPWASTASNGAVWMDQANPGRVLRPNNGSAKLPNFTSLGAGANLTGGASATFWKSSGVAADVPLNPGLGFTFIAAIRPVSSTPSADCIFFSIAASSDSSYYLAYQVPTTGHLGLSMRGTGTGPQITSSVQLLANTDYTIGGWSNGTNDHGLRLNGTSYTTSTANGSYTAPNRFCIGELWYSGGDFGIGDNYLYALLLFNKKLTVTRIDELCKNPWQVFEPYQVTISYAAPGGGTVGLTGTPSSIIAGSVAPGTSIAL